MKKSQKAEKIKPRLVKLHSDVTVTKINKNGKPKRTYTVKSKSKEAYEPKPIEGRLYRRSEEEEKALDLAASEFPALADLIEFFEPDIVMRMLTIFSGQTIIIPKFETVWSSFRNIIIKNELDKKNDKETRERMALRFDISMKEVSNIYHYMKHRKPKKQVSRARSKQFAGRLYRGTMPELIKEFREILVHKHRRRY